MTRTCSKCSNPAEPHRSVCWTCYRQRRKELAKKRPYKENTTRKCGAIEVMSWEEYEKSQGLE